MILFPSYLNVAEVELGGILRLKANKSVGFPRDQSVIKLIFYIANKDVRGSGCLVNIQV